MSFVNVNEYPSLEKAVERIVELDSNDNLYLEMMKEPWINNSDILYWESRFSDFFCHIAEKPLESARYMVDDGMQKLYKQNFKILAFANEKLKISRLISAYRKIKDTI